MSKFRKKEFKCVLCGDIMVHADAEVLVCPTCKHSVNVEDYIVDVLDYDDLYGGIRAEDKFEDLEEPYEDVYEDDDED